jgi:hypothetical protein
MDRMVSVSEVFGDHKNALDSRANANFCIGNFEVDVDKAYSILRGKSKIKVFDLEMDDELDVFLKLFPEMERHAEIILNMGHEINLELPLLMIYARSTPPEKTVGFITDGWVRIFKARKEGVKTLPCILLSKKESRSVVVSEGMHYKKVRL